MQDLIDFSNRSEESEYEDEVGKIPFYKIKVNQSYVIVEYEEGYFPGMVKQRKGRPTKLEVSTMNMCAGTNY